MKPITLSVKTLAAQIQVPEELLGGVRTMTEAEWLICEDPLEMVKHLTQESRDTGQSLAGYPIQATNKREPPLISDRKLRLFTVAALRRVARRGGPPDQTATWALDELERFADDGNEDGLYEAWKGHPLPRPGIALATSAAARIHAQMVCEYPMPDQRTYTAAILRDIAGNPFRPVTLPIHAYVQNCPTTCLVGGRGHRSSRPTSCGGCRTKWKPVCDWRTPTVLSLAQAAYGENKCSCWGTNTAGGPQPAVFCPECRGEGWLGTDNRNDDGTLDPVRLSILADALEEAGCPVEEKRSVRMGKTCLACGRHTRQAGEGFRPEARRCDDCNRTWVQGEHYLWPLPHPILAHLRSPGPHVRGCWAVDCVLGKE